MELTDAFLLSNFDFWWETVRHESYGVIFVSITACCYHFTDGCCLFMSGKTRAKISDSDLVTKKGEKSKLHFFIKFERFIEENTGLNIGIWLNKSHNKATIKH